MKSTAGFSRLWPSLAVILAYGISFYSLSLTLRTMPVGVAYAIWSGAGVVPIALVGRIFLCQSLDWPALLDIGLNALAVVVINVFSSSVSHGGSWT